MFLDINKIEPEGQSLDLDLDLGSLPGPAGETIEVLRAHLRGRAQRGGRGVELAARLEGTLRLTCSRCLAPFEHPLGEDFFLLLVADGADRVPARGEQANDEDIALFRAEDGKAGLREIAVEQVYLHLPLKAVCQNGCRGLCPECGVDRNRQACGCERNGLDPRLAPLLRLKGQ